MRAEKKGYVMRGSSVPLIAAAFSVAAVLIAGWSTDVAAQGSGGFNPGNTPLGGRPLWEAPDTIPPRPCATREDDYKLYELWRDWRIASVNLRLAIDATDRAEEEAKAANAQVAAAEQALQQATMTAAGAQTGLNRARATYNRLKDRYEQTGRGFSAAASAAISLFFASATNDDAQNGVTSAKQQLDAAKAAAKQATAAYDSALKAQGVAIEKNGEAQRNYTKELETQLKKKCPKAGGRYSTPRMLEPWEYLTLGPSMKFGVEAGGGWARNGLEDFAFDGSGFIAGVSGEFNVPIGAGAYAGLGVSVLGSGVSGTLADPTTTNIRLLVPVDGIVGTTFTPSGWRWPVSIYGFGGLAIGDVNVSSPPFSATQTMTGWSIGAGADLQLSPTWSVGVKYRHFDLGNANFSVFPGGTSLVTERGDMVTGTLSYHFPISPPAPVAPFLTK